MTRSGRLHSICALALLSPACAAHAQIPVYDATQVPPSAYRVVKRLWVEDWRSAFEVPRDPTREAAAARLARAAEAVGADAVVNAYCAHSGAPPRGHYCYGNAVKLVRKP